LEDNSVYIHWRIILYTPCLKSPPPFNNIRSCQEERMRRQGGERSESGKALLMKRRAIVVQWPKTVMTFHQL
jgi:hypothetical protein